MIFYFDHKSGFVPKKNNSRFVRNSEAFILDFLGTLKKSYLGTDTEL